MFVNCLLFKKHVLKLYSIAEETQQLPQLEPVQLLMSYSSQKRLRGDLRAVG